MHCRLAPGSNCHPGFPIPGNTELGCAVGDRVGRDRFPDCSCHRVGLRADAPRDQAHGRCGSPRCEWFEESHLAQQARGDHAAADAALKGLIATHGDNFPFQIALVYAGRRETEKLFEWLDRAYAARQPLMSNYVVSHPLLKPYYSDRRFVELCNKIGVTVPK